jgi:Acetyltransferases
MSKTAFEFCDFKNPAHTEAYTQLLNQYMSDPMGDYPMHDAAKKQKLIDSLSKHPTALVLLMLSDGQYAGFSTCFVNFSTFKIKPYLYIHDVFVRPDFRGKKLGKKLMEKLTEIAQERAYCKISLEVRSDNDAAKKLYNSLGFEECKPNMHYWEKLL